MSTLRVLAEDRIATALVWGAALAVSAFFLWILGDVVRHGTGALSLEFLVSEPLSAGRAGGIGPVIVSTALLLMVTLAAALPLGLGTSILLAEVTRKGGAMAMAVRRSLDILAGVPSIVFGLFGNAFFAVRLGLGFSILSGGLTLACMVLPLLVRVTEAGLRAAPDEYRTAAAALGFSRTTTLLRLLIPAAAPALAAGLVLAIARALAETAALLFTSGYGIRMPRSLMDSGRSLSVHIFDLAMNVPGGESHAYGSALVLVGLLLGINGAAFLLAERWLGGRVVGA